MTRLQQIAELGQAIWLDYISRDLLNTGELDRLVKEGLLGMTSNPSIFQKAISGSDQYDDEIVEHGQNGTSVGAIFEKLAVADIGAAADRLRTVYDRTKGVDGYVSIEVSPKSAYDTSATIEEGRHLFKTIGRPNVMIKVPATPAGLPAITTLISEGINVNVTLIFAIDTHKQVMDAYIRGLTQRHEKGEPVSGISSVASFFVSRVDTRVDADLEKLAATKPEAKSLMGRAAVANAKIAYYEFQQVFQSDRFAKLRSLGARVQRPLWASTGTKNPAYSPVKYVDPLIGPDTVNTVPPQTLEAIREHSKPQRQVDQDVQAEFDVMDRLKKVGVDMKAVTDDLLVDGVKQFADAFAKLLGDLETKRNALLTASR